MSPMMTQHSQESRREKNNLQLCVCTSLTGPGRPRQLEHMRLQL